MGFSLLQEVKVDKKNLLKKIYAVFNAIDASLASKSYSVSFHFRNYFELFMTEFIKGDKIKIYRDFDNTTDEFKIDIDSNTPLTAKAIEKIIKDVETILLNGLTSLSQIKYNNFEDTNDFLNVVYKMEHSIYIKNNSTMKPLFVPSDDGDYTTLEVPSLTISSPIIDLLSTLVSMSDIVVYKNNIVEFPRIKYVNDKFNMCNYVLKNIKGVPRVIADFKNIMPNRIKNSIVSRLPIVSDVFKCLNNFQHPKTNLVDAIRAIENLDAFRQSRPRGFVNATDTLTYYTVFDNQHIDTVPCFITQKPILTSKTIDILAVLNFTNQFATDTEGICFIKDYRAWKVATKLGCQSKNHNGRIIYLFSDKHEDNFSKLDNVAHNYYDEIQRYGQRPDDMYFLNKGDSSRFKPDALYLGTELEFDDGGRSHENNTMYLSALTAYKLNAWSTFDSSVGQGFESKTVPAVIEKHMDKNYFDYEKAFEVLKTLGYRASNTDTCGLHIHINSTFFTDGYEGSRISPKNLALTLMVSILEQNWHDVVVFTRRSYDKLSQWAGMRNVFDTSLLTKLKIVKNHDTLVDTCNFVSDRYRGKHNAITNNRGSTYELRIFKSTLNITTYLATLQFTYNFAMLVRDLMKDIYDEIGDKTNFETPLNSLAKAFSVTFNDIVNYKHWSELDVYVGKFADFIMD